MILEVLRSYRKLYRTCQRVFEGDPAALQASKKKLKEEFLKNRTITDEVELSKLIGGAEEAEKFLREHVVQAVQTGENKFRMKITKDTVFADNMKLLRKEEDTKEPKLR